MTTYKTANRIPAAALFALLNLSAFPVTGVAGEDAQAERDSRRIEGEARRQQEMARIEMETRERAQVEALRGQEEAIRRMEATRARIEANSQQNFPQPVDQGRINTYPLITSSAPLELARANDPVSGMMFAPLSERLGGYFGAPSGVLVVRAGAQAPFGLQDGDVIRSIDGRVPMDERHIVLILRSYRPGERVKLQIQRDRRAIILDSQAPVRQP